MADDLGRYLAGEPVRARPVNALTRVWKAARRRPVACGSWRHGRSDCCPC